MDADNQDKKPFSFWLARHSGIQMSPNAMRILRAPVSREARVGEPSSRLHGPIVFGIRGVSVQMSFADQEMHYGAPYLLMCRGRSACGRRARRRSRLGLRVRCLADVILHHEQLQGYALHLLTMSAFG